MNQTSVLAIVPEWWSLLDTGKAQSMIAQLAEEDQDSDWGMRIISSKARIYNPAGYHFGSVWPLFHRVGGAGRIQRSRAVAGLG